MTLSRTPYLLAAGLAAALVPVATQPAHASWGVHATDATVAAAARTLPAAGTPGATAEESAVTVRWPQVLVAPATPADGYLVTRYDADSGAAAATLAGCAGVVAALSCTEAAVPDGRWRYAVRAVQGAKWVGPAGPTGPVLTVASTPGTAAVTFPAAGAGYGTTGYAAGCSTTAGDLCGTASPSGSAALTSVRVSVRRGTGNYWDPATGGFTAATERLSAVTAGLAAWRLDFPVGTFPASGAYTVRTVATDTAGRSATASSTFTLDLVAPTAADVQAANTSGGTAGRIEAGDQLALTYSEPLAPGTVKTGWTGAATAVKVRVDRGTGATGRDQLVVLDTEGALLARLGTVSLGQRGYVSQVVEFAATMTQDGATIRLTVGTPSAPNRIGTVTVAGDLAWTVGAGATDPAGNPVANADTVVTEQRQPAADLDF